MDTPRPAGSDDVVETPSEAPTVKRVMAVDTLNSSIVAPTLDNAPSIQLAERLAGQRGVASRRRRRAIRFGAFIAVAAAGAAAVAALLPRSEPGVDVMTLAQVVKALESNDAVRVAIDGSVQLVAEQDLTIRFVGSGSIDTDNTRSETAIGAALVAADPVPTASTSGSAQFSEQVSVDGVTYERVNGAWRQRAPEDAPEATPAERLAGIQFDPLDTLARLSTLDDPPVRQDSLTFGGSRSTRFVYEMPTATIEQLAPFGYTSTWNIEVVIADSTRLVQVMALRATGPVDLGELDLRYRYGFSDHGVDPNIQAPSLGN